MHIINNKFWNIQTFINGLLSPKERIGNYNLHVHRFYWWITVKNLNFYFHRPSSDSTNSVFPSTIKSWNTLSPQLRNAPTLNRFKQANKKNTINPPKFYIAGCRILNIIHTRLRHRSSSLNADLFRVHLANDPGCICGCAFEDAIHYILECFLYNEAREDLKLRLVFLNELKIEVLLFGDDP